MVLSFVYLQQQNNTAMKTKIAILILSIVFLASCSSSRYGSVPKVRKHNQTVAQKPAKKKQVIAETEEIASKPVDINTEIAAAEIPLAPQKQDIATMPAPSNTVAATPAPAPKTVETIKKGLDIKERLSPRQIKKLEKLKKHTSTKEVEKGSWLWYVVVGLILVIIGAIIPWVLGWIIYVVGTIAIIYGLLMLLGIV